MERGSGSQNIDDLWELLQQLEKRIEDQQTESANRTRDQEARIEGLEAQLRTHRGVARGSAGNESPETSGGPVSRATLLKAAALGAAAATAGIMAAPETAQASDGGAVLLGLSGNAEHATEVNFDGTVSPGAVFLANATSFGPTASSFPSALAGWTTNSLVPNGIYGYSTQVGGSAIVGYHAGSGAGGNGVEGTSYVSYGGYFQGGKAPLCLQPSYSVGAPTTNPHNAGEVYVDFTGTFYICTAAGTPGTWKRLATTDLGLQSFSAPYRVYGSPMTYNQVSGATSVTAAGVPAGARSAYCAVQAMPSATGPLTLFPAGAADPGIANWTAVQPNVLNLFYMLVPLNSAGQFQIHSYLNGSVYVDVWGYLM